MVRCARALVALAFAIGSAALAAEPSGSLFLVAKPQLADPNFGQSVVLLTQFGRLGSMGVIVNRPTGLALSRVFTDVKRLAQTDDRFFFGGPVSRDVVLFVFRAPEQPDEAFEVLEGVYISSDRELLKGMLGRDKPPEALRVFMGYAGWAAGQLEAEISRGDWDLVQADAKTIFAKKPEALWPELNRRASETTVRGGPALVPAVMTMKGGVPWR
jgi:putative transcriptional regulator